MATADRLVTIQNGRSRLDLQPQGSRIIKLILGGYEISGVIARGDDKKASSHPCAPQFDKDTSNFFLPELPRHGIMRETKAKILDNEGGDVISAITELENKDSSWKLIVEQYYSISRDNLEISTHIRNLRREIPVNYGNHTYFHAPHGWEEVTLNGQKIARAIEEDAILVWKLENLLVIPGLPRLMLTQHNLPYANPWTGIDSEGNYDRHYFSLSSVTGNFREGYLGSPQSMLRRGESRYNRLTIALAA